MFSLEGRCSHGRSRASGHGLVPASAMGQGFVSVTARPLQVVNEEDVVKMSRQVFGAIVALALAGGACANADSLLLDRGLPTANLNDAAGANRSNVAWADAESSNNPSDYYLPGDNFTLGGTGSYQIHDITVWVVGHAAPSGLSLLGGVAGSPAMSTISSNFSATPTAYADSTTYQGSSGSSIPIYQVDFSVNVDVNAGQTYDFFLNGPWTADGSFYVNSFLHASNGPLSGSTQQGSDGQLLWLHVNGSSQDVESWYSSGTPTGTSPFGAGWDKNSDANVQVFGVSATPLPSSVWGGIALLGLLGLGGAAKRFRGQIA